MTSNNPEYQATEQGFFAAIAENPHDLANWLIFADFLQDHGHPAADVTRLWAAYRFGSRPLGDQERARLDALLTAGLRPRLPRRVNSIGMEFVLVPSGTFWMSENNEHARRQVEVPYSFYTSIHPVTQEQWQTVMGNNPSWFSRTGGGRDGTERIAEAELEQFPVETVSWEDVQHFLAELNRREKPGGGGLHRLPSEAEWEYACRGGATSREECSFNFYLGQPTNDLSSAHANFNGQYPAGNAPKGSCLNRPTRVGSYQANALGIHDMHGNVWEWCQDWYEEGSSRVMRGGSWYDNASDCRAAYREGDGPGSRYYCLGFRIALVPPGK
jgi:uncharacterized protein (TIGR02996 family)